MVRAAVSTEVSPQEPPVPAPIGLMLTYIVGWTVTFGVLGCRHVLRRRRDSSFETSGPLLMGAFIAVAIGLGAMLL